MASLTRTHARGMATRYARSQGFQKINQTFRAANPLTGQPMLMPSAMAKYWREWFAAQASKVYPKKQDG